MDDRAALLIPNRCFNAWRDTLVVEVLDSMPPGMRALFEDVVDSVRSDDRRFEITAPDRGAEAEISAVGEFNRLLIGLERVDHGDRPEELFLGDRCFGR